ncbi:TrbI/VirB10 family protein [Halodesulfovibrio sp.]|jgi:type IV secretion system protein VirB10|uniref:TrbI/VirB10 family protein n=1 Tax=Halodesulfovibrio sp. TaxID=1912772 RepID=UPI0025F9EE80|nr:TrbI/VirB10 family protein [Halodesulfovibrio sp.]MCT4625667.1 conjugal transfer protein TrbI [Halodesulfovibrio sp.]
MSDTPDPQSYDRPKVRVTKLNKNLLYVIFAIGLGLLIFLAMEVDRSTTKTVKMQEEQNAPAPPDNKLPVVNPGNSAGLAIPTPQPEPAKDEYQPEQIVVVPTSTRNPALALKNRELAELRKIKWEQLRKAYTSPLETSSSIPVINEKQVVSETAVSQSNLPEAALTIVPPAEGMNMSSIATNESYDPADQRDKETFLSSRSKGTTQWTLPHSRTAGSPFELKTGALIPGIMLSGINSDLPGQIIGQVSQNVYATANEQHLLIPQGSRMIGVYDSRIVTGQSRLLIAWNRIVFPDGSSITLGSMPGADIAGYSGVEDETNNHYLRIYGSAVIMSVLSGVSAYASDTFKSSTAQNDKPSLQDELGSALASQLGQTSLKVLQKNLNIQPTLTIRPGSHFNMVVIKDIVFRAPYTNWR